MRVLLAIVLVPALLPGICFGYLFLADGQAAGETGTTFRVILPLSYIAMVALGLPGHFALRRAHVGALSVYLALGFAVGIIAQLADLDGMVDNWHLWWGVMRGRIGLPAAHVLGGQGFWWLHGAAGGGLFWLIARPDKSNGATAKLTPFDGPHRRAR